MTRGNQKLLRKREPQAREPPFAVSSQAMDFFFFWFDVYCVLLYVVKGLVHPKLKVSYRDLIFE